MSEVRTDTKAPRFFELYRNGDIAAEDVDEYVGRWHADAEPWAKDLSLHEYLGMSHDEYEVWLCDPRSLPALVQARRSGRALVDAVADYYAAMLITNRPENASALHSLGSWLKRHQGRTDI